jgi:two-component system response regulator PilR (NtrC family)
MRILVVDDNPEIIEEISQTLRRRGHEVISATGVKDALVALATQAPVACVITDMRLPEGSGADVLRVANRLHPSSLKFLMSGEANTDEINEARREGLEAIFWKPVSLRMVVEAVHERDKAAMARDLIAAH